VRLRGGEAAWLVAYGVLPALKRQRISQKDEISRSRHSRSPSACSPVLARLSLRTSQTEYAAEMSLANPWPWIVRSVSVVGSHLSVVLRGSLSSHPVTALIVSGGGAMLAAGTVAVDGQPCGETIST